MSITEYCKKNRSLTALNCSACGIDDIGGQAVVDMLKLNKKCNFLELYKNLLTDHSICAIAESLELRKSFKHLDVLKNPFTEKGAEALQRTVSNGQSQMFIRPNRHCGIQIQSHEVAFKSRLP